MEKSDDCFLRIKERCAVADWAVTSSKGSINASLYVYPPLVYPPLGAHDSIVEH